MITPLPLKQPSSPTLSGICFHRDLEQGAATERSTARSTGSHFGERNSEVLPQIQYSARALRTTASPSKPRLSPGASVGVYTHGRQGVTGGALARVVCEDAAANTVKVELNGEEKELPASSVFDLKLMNLVTGMSPGSKSMRRPMQATKSVELPKMQQHLHSPPAKPVELPKMQQNPHKPTLDITDNVTEVASGFQLPSPSKACWQDRQEANLKHQRMNAPKGSNFSHGLMTSAETWSEVHLLLSRSTARTGPPCDAKTYKSALLKKFWSLELAWEALDTNGDGSLDFAEFTRACRQIEFSGNLKKIFKELTQGEDMLRPELLDPELPAKLQRLRLNEKDSPRQALQKRDASPDVSSSGFNHGRRGSNAETLGEVHLLLSSARTNSGPLSDARSFKNALLKKFQRFDVAWEEIDSNENDTIEFSEFLRACRMMNFAGNLKQIYKELTRGEKVMKPAFLDPSLPKDLEKIRSSGLSPRSGPGGQSTQQSPGESGSLFTMGGRNSAVTMAEVRVLLDRPFARSGPPDDAKAFKAALLKKFERLGPAWMKIDANGDGLLSYLEFVRACRKIQFSGNFKKIFQELTGGEESLRPELLDAHLPAELKRLQQYGEYYG